MKRAIRDDPRYRCHCNVHVENFACAVALIGFAVNAASVAHSLQSTLAEGSASAPRFVAILMHVFGVFAFAGIPFAQWRRRSEYYLPFFGFAFIHQVALGLLILTIIGFGLFDEDALAALIYRIIGGNTDTAVFFRASIERYWYIVAFLMTSTWLKMWWVMRMVWLAYECLNLQQYSENCPETVVELETDGKMSCILNSLEIVR